MRHSDFAFANDVRAAVSLRTPRTAHLLLMVAIGLLVSGGVWAHYAVLDEVRASSRVRPTVGDYFADARLPDA